MKLINFILPSLTTTLSKGHINAEELQTKIQNFHGSEGYYCLFDLEPRDSFQGYRGFHSPALGYFVLDFDSSDNIGLAQHDCLEAVRKLALEPGTFKVYFSGGKGFHLYIRQEFFPITPSDSTAKEFERVANQIGKALNLPTLDDGIYQANRKFRLPNSLHPKTGLHKIELTLDQLEALSVEAIKELAKSPSVVSLSEYATPSTKWARGSISGTTVALSPASFGLDASPDTDNIFSKHREKHCISALLSTKHKEGRRHEVALVAISDYYHQGRTQSETEKVIEEFCSLNGIRERYERDYSRAISDIYSGKAPYTFGCYSKIKKEFCSSSCTLYKKLKPELRASVPQVQPNLPSAHHTQTPEPTMTEGSGDSPIFPDMGKNAPLATIQNIQALLDFYGIEVGYNLIKKDIQIRIPNLSLLKDNAKSNSLVHIVSLASRHKIPRGGVEEFVEYLASNNPFNPAVRWITSTPWDGVSRLQSFYDTLVTKADDKPLKETLMRKWMLSAIAAAFSHNGSAGSGILVLQGAQYMGKTKWFKDLVPAELEIIKDGMMLDPKDKDSVYQCVTNWLVELGEVDATFRKADIAHLKAFLTKDTDVLRLAYSRKTSEFARRTVFFASVNQEDYLNDPTGNRRFWTIECEAIHHSHKLPMQQIWAEVYELYKAGEGYFLTQSELLQLNSRNEDFTTKDPFEDMVLKKYDLDGSGDFLSSLDILSSFGIGVPSARDYSRLAAVMKTLRAYKGRDGGVRGYIVKRKDLEQY